MAQAHSTATCGSQTHTEGTACDQMPTQRGQAVIRCQHRGDSLCQTYFSVTTRHCKLIQIQSVSYHLGWSTVPRYTILFWYHRPPQVSDWHFHLPLQRIRKITFFNAVIIKSSGRIYLKQTIAN